MLVFEISETKCTQCMKCFEACPVQAVSIADGIHIMQDRCISCGDCYRACSHHAIQQISELDKVKQFIKSNRKVILAIDPACLAFLPDNVSLEQLAAAVQELGVWDVADASEAAAAIAQEYARIIHDGKNDNIIMSQCPVVTNLIEQYYPENMKYLAPTATAMIAHGRMLKRDFTSAAIVYVSACAARLAESRDVRHSTEINAVLSIGELLAWIEDSGIELSECEPEPLLSEGGGIGELAAISGGITEATEFFAGPIEYKKICADGVESCISLLKELSLGKIRNCLIEMNACPGGCVGGYTGFGEQKNPRGRFSAMVEIRNYVDSHDKKPYIDTHGIALSNPSISYHVAEKPVDEKELEAIFSRIGMGNERLRLNCGKCGYSGCRERAEAILKGEESPVTCTPVIEEVSRDIYSIFYQNIPVAAVLIDDTQKIVDFNKEAGLLLGLKKDQEKYVFEVMDPGDVQYVLDTQLPIMDRRYDIPELFLKIEASFVPVKECGMVIGLIEDITEKENHEEQLLQSRMQSVDMAQKIIEKQMNVAQQIAFLLGETTAETKVTLNQLKSRILNEELDK